MVSFLFFIFFFKCEGTLITLLQVTGTIHHVTHMAAQPKYNKLKQFPICANVGVLFSLEILLQACEKHIQTRFSL